MATISTTLDSIHGYFNIPHLGNTADSHLAMIDIPESMFQIDHDRSEAQKKDQNMRSVSDSLEELDQLSVDEVESILKLASQDGHQGPVQDQQVPDSHIMSTAMLGALKIKKRKELTYAQKLKRLKDPEQFEAELLAGPKKKKQPKKRRKTKPPCLPELNEQDGLLTALETHGVIVPKVDLALAMGIPEEELTQQKIALRKHIIRSKLRKGKYVYLTVCEEYDVHTRAENYASSMTPHPEYCYLKWEKHTENDQDFMVPQSANMGALVEKERPARSTGKRKRKRKSRSGDYYIVHPFGHAHSSDDDVVLPQGLCLVRPPNKLVELVAQAISGSPDGLLQVQQVYHTLQNKYPYFRYMDKTSLTSWRSSIRHALYQKWFRKVGFQSDFINCRGCYWGINRKNEPREWCLPPVKSAAVSRPAPDTDDGRLGDGLQSYVPAGPLTGSNDTIALPSMADIMKETEDACPSSPCYETGEVSPVLLRSPAMKSERLHLPRDPDPMFAPQEPFLCNSRQEEILSVDSPSALSGSSSEWLNGSESPCDLQSSEGSEENWQDPHWNTYWEHSLQNRYHMNSPDTRLPTFSLTLPTTNESGVDLGTCEVPVHWSPLTTSETHALMLESYTDDQDPTQIDQIFII